MNYNSLKKILILLFFLATINYSQRQIFYTIPLEGGPASNSIVSVAQDKSGAMIFGTNTGLAYFDGSEFVNEDFPKIKNELIVSLFVDSDTTLYVGTLKGFAVLKANGQKIFYDSLDARGEALVFSFYENIDRILIATSRGVFAYKNGKIFVPSEFAFMKGKRVYEVEYSNGQYFVATKQGVFAYSLKNSNWKPLLHLSTFGIEIDKRGVAWFSTIGGIFTYRNSRVELFSSKLKAQDRYSLLVYNKNLDLFALKNYVDPALPNSQDKITFIKNGKIVKVFTDFEHSPSGIMFFDKDNSLWVSSVGGYLIKYLSLDIELYERHYGVKSNPFDFCQRRNGDILVGTDGHGVLKFDGNKFVVFDKTLPATVWQIFEDSEERLWISSIKGIFYYDKNGKKNEIRTADGKPLLYGSVFYQDDKGRIWFSASEGIYIYDGKNVSKIYTFPNSTEMVYKILPADENNLWICFNDKIKKFNGENFIAFPYEKQLEEYSYSGMVMAPDGKYVFPSNSGVVIFDEKGRNESEAIKRITINDGLVSDIVFWAFFDNDDNLWLLTSGGLSVLDYKKYSTSAKILLTNFSQGDPVIGGEYNQFSSLVDNSGNIWLGGTSGVIRITNPRGLLFRKQILQPYLKNVEIIEEDNSKKRLNNERPAISVPKLTLKYDQNSVLLNLAAVSLTNPKLISFRYNFHPAGKDEKMNTPWIKHKKVYIINLPPNEYVLDLEVRDQYGNTKRSRNLLKLEIQMPFWKTRWFISLVTLTIVMIIILLILVRERALKKRAANLQELLHEKEELANELEQTSNEYQDLFENAFTPMLILDMEEFKVIDANNSASKLFQYTNMQFRKLAYEDLFLLPKDDFYEHFKSFKKTKTTYYHFESKMKLANGKVIDTEINAKVIKYKGEESIILVIRDVSQEKELEENLRNSMELLEKTEKMKADFLAQMSHEIRTPLNSITSFATLLYEQYDDMDEDFRDGVRSIVKSTKRIIRTVELMLNKSQLDAEVYAPIIRDVDLIKMLKLIVDEFSELAQFQGVDLNFVYDENQIWVKGDEYSLQQIFINIIDNALKYTKEGRVDVIAKTDEDKIVIEIRDTGVGIKKEFLPDLFKAFSQEEEGYKRKFDGNGLGLAVVSAFCDLNDCEIEVESEKGKGSVFRLIFNR